MPSSKKTPSERTPFKGYVTPILITAATILALYILWSRIPDSALKVFETESTKNSSLGTFPFFATSFPAAIFGLLLFCMRLKKARQSGILKETIFQMIGLIIWGFGIFAAIGVTVYQYLPALTDKCDKKDFCADPSAPFYVILAVVVLAGFVINVFFAYRPSLNPVGSANQIRRIMLWQLTTCAGGLALSISGEVGIMVKSIMLCIGFSGIGVLYLEPIRLSLESKETRKVAANDQNDSLASHRDEPS